MYFPSNPTASWRVREKCQTLFAYRYLKTGSLIPAAFEHGLWGDFLFTIGIGWFLYSGSIR